MYVHDFGERRGVNYLWNIMGGFTCTYVHAVYFWGELCVCVIAVRLHESLMHFFRIHVSLWLTMQEGGRG